jgi:hypothetical protein
MTVPLSEDSLQNFSLSCSATPQFSFSGKIDTRFTNIQCAVGPKDGWSVAAAFPFTSALCGGVSLLQDQGGAARMWETALLADYKVVQGSVGYKNGIGFPYRSLFCGVNLWLERGTGFNLSYDWARADVQPPEGSVALGFQLGRGASLVRCAIATNGTIRSSIARKILGKMELTVGTEVTIMPLTCTVGVSIDSESHGF